MNCIGKILRAWFVACLLILPMALRADWAEFSQTPAAQQEITPETLDSNRLARAVFERTNLERTMRGIPPLSYSQSAEKAAALQSDLMRQRGSISHENPEVPQWEKLEQRAEWAGLNYRFIAENVATAFGRQYEAGRPFYTRNAKGGPVYSYQPKGPPIPRHTYKSFAEALVTAWMSSPGHKANILERKAEFLGVSCLPGKERDEMGKFYCTQVFFTPLAK